MNSHADQPSPESEDRASAGSFAPALPEQTEEFVRLFGMAYRNVYSLLWSLLPDADDVEEVMQETSLVLWRKFHEFRRDGDFARWACGIAYNQARRHRRDAKRLPRGFREDVLERIAAQRESDSPQLELRRRFLLECINKLTSKDRDLLNHCYRAAIPVKQAAAELGLSIFNLYKKLRRIRQQLFTCIDRRLQREDA